MLSVRLFQCIPMYSNVQMRLRNMFATSTFFFYFRFFPLFFLCHSLSLTFTHSLSLSLTLFHFHSLSFTFTHSQSLTQREKEKERECKKEKFSSNRQFSASVLFCSVLFSVLTQNQEIFSIFLFLLLSLIFFSSLRSLSLLPSVNFFVSLSLTGVFISHAQFLSNQEVFRHWNEI